MRPEGILGTGTGTGIAIAAAINIAKCNVQWDSHGFPLPYGLLADVYTLTGAYSRQTNAKPVSIATSSV